MRPMTRRNASFLSLGWFATLLGCGNGSRAGSSPLPDAGPSQPGPTGTPPPTLSPDPARIRAASGRVATQTDEAILAESRRLGPVVSEIVRAAGGGLRAGSSTESVAARLVQETLARDLQPAMLGYNGFPAAGAISVNEEILHGLPSNRALHVGDLVKVEFGVVSGSAFASHSWTFAVGEPSEADRSLMETGRRALHAALDVASPPRRLGDIGAAIKSTADAAGVSVVRAYVGHGMGKTRIQDPQVHGVGTTGTGARLRPGWILNLHVILKRGTPEVLVAANRWTALADDNQRGVLYTAMVEITADGHRTLTTLE